MANTDTIINRQRTWPSDIAERSYGRTTSVRAKASMFLLNLVLMVACAAALAGIWEIAMQFQNDAYKAVTLFLGIITVTNLVCKYILWADGQLP